MPRDSDPGPSCCEVALRIRPLSEAEREEAATIVAHRVDEQMVVLMDPGEDPDDILRAHRSREKTYMFDVAFDCSASQEEVYRATTKGLIEGLISGYNATVFAYGPTGCGKTYTMLGTDRDPGIYVQTLNDLFRAIEETSDDMQYSVSMSYLEIYNEMIRDLLNPASGFLDLREDFKGEIQVAGITEVSTINAREIMELLMKGNKQRTQEPTAANQTSSRSHAVLQVAVRQQSRCRDVLQEVRFARLFMIDLAGSERASQTQNRGQRLKEGAHINRSLLALGNCINALSEKNGNKYVNYRDSKLTRLLKDSLGGNSRTVMIAHISPASLAFEESRNTLTYADRAKSIRTRVKKNLLNVSYHIAQYTSIIADLRSEIQRLKNKISEQADRQTSSSTEHADIRHVQAQVQAHTSLQSREEMDQLREQLIQAFRQQMEIRKTLVELENCSMEIQSDTSKHLLTITDWEQEQSRRACKWQAERRKESANKDESEDCESPETPPDTAETEEVTRARHSLVTLMGEQKRIQKKKVVLERQFRELREGARRLEELLPRRVSSDEQREVLGLLCKVHELEIENAEMQSHTLLKDNLIRQKNYVVQRFEQHRHLCDEIIQQQRQFINDHKLLVPQRLQQLYEMYCREPDYRSMDRAVALDKVSICTLRDLESDQESVRTLGSDPQAGHSTTRRHTLPPILAPPEGDSNRVFKNSPHPRRLRHTAVMTPPPIRINGLGSQEGSSLRYSHLSHSVSSHLDSSPESSSETGADALLTCRERQQILRGVKNIAVKAARRRSRARGADTLQLAPPLSPPTSPLPPSKQKSSLSLSESTPSRGPAQHPAPPRAGLPSPRLHHAASDDNLSSSTADGPALQGTWTRPRLRLPVPSLGRDVPGGALKEQDFQARRRKRRSRSFEVTGQAVMAQGLGPLDSSSDPHLHISVQPTVPTLRPQLRPQPRPQPRAFPPLTRAKPPLNTNPTGPPIMASGTSPGPLGHQGSHKRKAHLRLPQPLLHINNVPTGVPRTRKH
ncbi:kinesin-like protein KIF19 isoform X2 [Anguilla anguilla]|uniref:kinesin-like protein KIF19 isoform X2 n=1 Tax=Anguilla anguilla TaxID=7936 RepID=UPI0015ABEFDE|nr:kinesin-like protein KIF19 isoform X2 [Anguilla anguilla]